MNETIKSVFVAIFNQRRDNIVIGQAGFRNKRNKRAWEKMKIKKGNKRKFLLLI